MNRAQRGLVIWSALTVVLGIAGVPLGMPELAATVGVGLLLATAHAADAIPAWSVIARVMGWTLQIAGIVAMASLFNLFAQFSGTAPFPLALKIYLGAAVLALLAALPTRAAERLAAAVDRSRPPSEVMTLTVRMALVVGSLCVPLWLLFRRLPDYLHTNLRDVLGAGDLVASFLGYILLALAGVGWMVRRGFRAALERLGVRPLRGVDVAWVVLGTAALFGVSTGGEWLMRTHFPSAYASDHAFDEMLAGALTGPGMVGLGLTAGIGEELTLRGALQPRMGLLLTSLLFALLHVQYSLIGIGFIFVFGLALGWLRSHTNTTVSMIVHSLYDVIALLVAAQGAATR